MMRNVYLQGELGERFGSKFSMSVDTRADIFKCINANRPDFREYLVECHKNDIDFIMEYQGETTDEKDLLTPLKEGDVTISIVPAGSKKGLGKILAAIAIVAIMFYMPTTFGTIAEGATTATLSAGLSTYGTMAATLAVNLALTGIGQIMAPDPSVDTDAPDNYSFNGNTQNISIGDPVPLLYGELRVPGRPISLDVSTGKYTNSSTYVDANGEVTVISDNTDLYEDYAGDYY